MGFSDPFIRRPVATVLLTIGLVLLGLTAYRNLAVASLPSVDLPIIRVSVNLPGASPETMAGSVATPLERQFGTIAGLEELTSINLVGNSTMILQFALSKDIDAAARAVQAAINAAAPNLPKDLPRPPTYFKANPSAQPILQIAMTSQSLQPSLLYDYADTIVSQKISQLPGVADVQLSGAEKSAVRIAVNPGALASMGLSMEQVRTAVAGTSVAAPKGSLDGPDQSWSIAADDQMFTADQYRQLIITLKNGTPVRLGDVATVTESVANTKLAGWWNDQRGVIVYIRKQPNANTVETVDRIRAILPQIQTWLPPSVQLHVTSDRTLSIRAAIADVQFTMLVTTTLVIMVIGLFLRRFWATMIPSLTIPVSLIATFAVMYLLKYSLDNLSLMALTVAVGFVVDDAIVMIEHIVRLQETGLTPRRAALKGARQIGFTILSITISLVAALLPILLLPGIQGRFFSEFGATLAVAIAVSALVSLTLTPMLCARLPARVLGAEPGWFDRFFAVIERLYAASLRRVLRHHYVMMGLTLAIMVGTVMLYGVVPKAFLPTQDTGIVRGTTEASPDISFTAMRNLQRRVSDIILADPAVDSLTSSIGGGAFSNLNNGGITLTLKPSAARGGLSSEQVIDRLRLKLGHIPGMATYLTQVQDFGFGGRGSKARYQYTLLGGDLGTLVHWVSLMRTALQAVPELADIGTDQDSSALQTNVTIDRASATRLGVSPLAIDNALYDAFGQRQVVTLYKDLDQFKVVLELDPRDQQDTAALTRIFVPGLNGLVPLDAITKLEPGLAPATLNHQGQQTAITITFNTRPGVAIGDAINKIKAVEARVNLPPEITAAFGGDARAASQSSSDTPLLFLTAIFAVYLVLGILYESFVHPITILSTIPSAGLGALLALLITRMDLSLIAIIGIILLIGIVKKNAILMVDFALDAQRHRGLSPRDAILEAAVKRLRPITMTTLAAVLGALPMAIGTGAGSELRQPLGVTMVGGLIVSQIVTIYTTPVIYLGMEWWRTVRLSRLWQRRPVAVLSGS